MIDQTLLALDGTTPVHQARMARSQNPHGPITQTRAKSQQNVSLTADTVCYINDANLSAAVASVGYIHPSHAVTP